MKNKIKKIKSAIVTFLAGIIGHINVLGSTGRTALLYGVIDPRESENIIIYKPLILRILLIPIILIIGAIVYVKKSKSSTKKKVIVGIVASVIYSLIALYLYNKYKYILFFKEV